MLNFYSINENEFHLPVCMRLTAKKITATLKQHGYKLTPQRRAVVDAIAHSHEHLAPAAIHGRVLRERPGTGLVTIYRTLDILAELGLLCKVHMEGSCRSYLMRRPPEHHHHLICSHCGRVVDFTDCALDKLEQKLCRGTGYKLEGHLLQFLGCCPDCQKEPS